MKNNKRKIEKRAKQRKDYEKKRNIKSRNWQKNLNLTLGAGDGILPVSRKYKAK